MGYIQCNYVYLFHCQEVVISFNNVSLRNQNNPYHERVKGIIKIFSILV